MKNNIKLIERLINDLGSVDNSLTHRKSGILLALAYYYRYECEPNLREGIKTHLINCVEDLLEALGSETMDGSLGNGVTGISVTNQFE